MHSWQSLVVYLIDCLIDRVFRGSISPKKDVWFYFKLRKKGIRSTRLRANSPTPTRLRLLDRARGRTIEVCLNLSFPLTNAESNWFEGARSWNDYIFMIYCQCQASPIFIISRKPYRVPSKKAWKTTERTRSEVDEVYSPLNGGSLLEWHIPFRGKVFLTQPPNVVAKIWLFVEPFLELNKITATIVIEPIW